MSRGSKTWYGACQVDTRCFLLLLGLCLLFCELDRRRRGNSSCSIRVRQARLSVWIWKAIWVWQGLRLLRLLRAHGSYGCWAVRLRLLRPVPANRMKSMREKEEEDYCCHMQPVTVYRGDVGVDVCRTGECSRRGFAKGKRVPALPHAKTLPRSSRITGMRPRLDGNWTRSRHSLVIVKGPKPGREKS
jgi:hypothetical protein